MFQNIITGRARIILYGIYGYSGWFLAAIVAAYYAAGQTNPRWLVIAGAVYMFLGKLFGQLAGDNVDLVGNVVPTAPAVIPASSPVSPPPAVATTVMPPAVTSPAVLTVASVPPGYVQTESGLVKAPVTNAGE